jgi:hypothetical protein
MYNHLVPGSRTNGEESGVWWSFANANTIVAMLVKAASDADLSLSFEQWAGAWHTAKDLTACVRPQYLPWLVEHHRHIESITQLHGWPTVIRYDISQCHMSAADKTSDISTYNLVTLMAASTKVLTAIVNHNAAKRPAVPGSSGTTASLSSSKRTCTSAAAAPTGSSGPCFQCGHASPCCLATCPETTTTANQPCALIDKSAKSPHAMHAPSGKAYCMGFATNRCCAAAGPHKHLCSVCQGAQSTQLCPHLA